MLKGTNVFCCCNIAIDLLFKRFSDTMKILLTLTIMWTSYAASMKGPEGTYMCLFPYQTDILFQFLFA